MLTMLWRTTVVMALIVFVFAVTRLVDRLDRFESQLESLAETGAVASVGANAKPKEE